MTDRHRMYLYRDQDGELRWHASQQYRLASQTYPMVSEAAAVHPVQVDEYTKFCRQNGCPTEFTRTGEVVFTSAQHRRKHLRLRGLHDRKSYC